MAGYGDASPGRVILLVGGVVLFFAVSEVTGFVGVLSASVASVTGIARFSAGCVVTVSLLTPLLVVTGVFEE